MIRSGTPGLLLNTSLSSLNALPDPQAMTHESGGKGNNESTWQPGNKGGKEPSYFWDSLPEGNQFSTTLKAIPHFCFLTNITVFIWPSGKEDTLASLFSDCPTFQEPTSRLHPLCSPSPSHSTLW